MANMAASNFGLLSMSIDPVALRNIGGNIIAGKIAAGTKDSIFFVLLLKISSLSKKIIENLVKKVITPQ